MDLNHENLRRQALEFRARNEQEVNAVQSDLVRSGLVLLDKVCSAVLGQGELSLVREALVGNNLSQVFSLLRPRAHDLGRVDHAGIYWEWIDAYGFFQDAVDTSWRYMTIERRAQALAWASQKTSAINSYCKQ